MTAALASRTALLGLRVADAARGEVVTGLRAWAWDARLDAVRKLDPAAARGQEPRRVRAARPGNDGVLAWHELPFFGGWQTTPGDDAAQWDPALRRDPTVLIVDPAGQLHPVRLRQAVPAPPSVPAPAAWQAWSAKLLHLALYALMIGLPLAGWIILSAEGKPVPFFGLELQALVAKNHGIAESFDDIHQTIGKIGYFLIGAHALAALVHHYAFRDNTLTRMLPRSR